MRDNFAAIRPPCHTEFKIIFDFGSRRKSQHFLKEFIGNDNYVERLFLDDFRDIKDKKGNTARMYMVGQPYRRSNTITIECRLKNSFELPVIKKWCENEKQLSCKSVSVCWGNGDTSRMGKWFRCDSDFEGNGEYKSQFKYTPFFRYLKTYVRSDALLKAMVDVFNNITNGDFDVTICDIIIGYANDNDDARTYFIYSANDAKQVDLIQDYLEYKNVNNDVMDVFLRSKSQRDSILS